MVFLLTISALVSQLLRKRFADIVPSRNWGLILLSILLLAGFVWPVWCIREGLASGDIRLGAILHFDELRTREWEMGCRKALQSALLWDPGLWGALAAIVTPLLTQLHKMTQWPAALVSLAGLLMLVTSPFIFLFSTLELSMLAWQVEVVLPRLWAMGLCSVIASFVNED